MSLLRFLGPSLFASAFVASGVRKFTKPSEQEKAAEALSDTVAPFVQNVLPSSYSSYVPEDANSWLRVTGGLEVAGGVLYATGKLRRLGAILLTAASGLNAVMAANDKDEESKGNLLTSAALLGGALVATQDLEGRPSVQWRAANVADRAGTRVEKAGRRAQKKAEKQAKKMSKQMEKTFS